MNEIKKEILLSILKTKSCLQALNCYLYITKPSGLLRQEFGKVPCPLLGKYCRISSQQKQKRSVFAGSAKSTGESINESTGESTGIDIDKIITESIGKSVSHVIRATDFVGIAYNIFVQEYGETLLFGILL